MTVYVLIVIVGRSINGQKEKNYKFLWQINDLTKLVGRTMFLCLFMFIFLKEKNNGVKKEMENDRAISKFQNKNKPFCKKTEERHNTSLKYISKD